MGFSQYFQMKNIQKFNVKTVKLFILTLLICSGCHGYIVNDNVKSSQSAGSSSTTYDDLVSGDNLFMHFPDDQITTNSKFCT